MAKKKSAARGGKKTGAIRVKTRRSAYAAGRTARTKTAAPLDASVSADIDAAVRQGEALRSDIERRIEAALIGF